MFCIFKGKEFYFIKIGDIGIYCVLASRGIGKNCVICGKGIDVWEENGFILFLVVRSIGLLGVILIFLVLGFL